MAAFSPGDKVTITFPNGDYEGEVIASGRFKVTVRYPRQYDSVVVERMVDLSQIKRR